MHNGCILSDKVKDNDYTNEFKVVDNKAYLPHYFDLNDSDAEELCKNIKSNNVNELIQIDNGFKEFSNLNLKERNVDLNPKKATNKSLLKLSKMFLKKKVSTRVLTIAFSIVIFVLLSVIQSFILFDLKPTEVVYNDNYIVMHKGDTYPLETSMRTAKLHGMVDSDMDAFLATGYQGDYYFLSNYGPDYSYSIYNNSYGLHNSHESFYFNKLTGTLKCDYEFIVNLFGVDGELKVLAGDLYDKPYGIILTDYMADALINYRYAISYENLIGADQYTYVNAIIDTNYEEEFKDLISFYATRPNYPDVDSFVKASYEQPDYEKYTQLISRYYSVGYTLNENFEEDLLESDFFNRYAYTGDFKAWTNRIKSYCL